MKRSFKDVINFLEEKGCNLDIMDRIVFEELLEDYDCMSNSDAELLGDLCNQDKYSVVDRENEEIIYDCMKDNGVVVINLHPRLLKNKMDFLEDLLKWINAQKNVWQCPLGKLVEYLDLRWEKINNENNIN